MKNNVLALALAGSLLTATFAQGDTTTDNTLPPQPEGFAGRPHRAPQFDVTAVAEQLGVSQEVLETALSVPPHLLQAAQTLGVDAQTLAEVVNPRAMRQAAREAALANAAEQLGVSVEALQNALHPTPPGMEALAQELGVTVEALQEALPPRPERGQMGRGQMGRGQHMQGRRGGHGQQMGRGQGRRGGGHFGQEGAFPPAPPAENP